MLCVRAIKLNKMTVKNLIIKLLEYNMDAEVNVVAKNKGFEFSMSYGSSEGVTKKTADNVSFYVDELNTNDEQ